MRLLEIFTASLFLFWAASASAEEYERFSKKDIYSSNDEQALILISYKLGPGEVYPPDFYLSKFDPVTRDEGPPFEASFTSKASRTLGLGGSVIGQRRYMKKAHPFVKRGTYFYTLKMPPGTYAVIAVDRLTSVIGNSSKLNETYHSMKKASFLFSVEAGKVNYVGNFRWGSRVNKICSLTREEYEAPSAAPKNPQEAQCFARFEQLDVERLQKPDAERGAATASVFLSENIPGVDDNRDFEGLSNQERIAVARTYLLKYRPNVEEGIAVALPELIEISLEKPIAEQLLDEAPDESVEAVGNSEPASEEEP